MTREEEFQKSWDAVDREWPLNERGLIHDSLARAVGDMLREFPEKTAWLLEQVGGALRKSEGKHVGLLWTCLRMYSPSDQRERLSRQFLNCMDKDIPHTVMRFLIMGVAAPREQEDFFEGAWPLLREHWQQSPEKLGMCAGMGLLPLALRNVRSAPFMERVLADTPAAPERTAGMMEHWVRLTSFGDYAAGRAQKILEYLLAQEPETQQQGLLDGALDKAARVIQSLDDVNIDQGQGQQSIRCLVSAGADWGKISRLSYPRAWNLMQSHPRVVAARLGDLAGIDTETGTGATPRRGM